MDVFFGGVAHIKQKKGLVPGGPDLANPEIHTNRGYLHGASHGCHDCMRKNIEKNREFRPTKTSRNKTKLVGGFQPI